MPTSTTTVKLESEIKDRLERIAESQHRAPETVMQEAIAEYVDRQEKLDGLRQETVAALEEFQRTGMHLTAEEVDEWLTKIAAGQTVPLPKCHL